MPTTTLQGPAVVTGASGMIGSAVCARLVAAGVEVHGLSRDADGAKQPGVRHWVVDSEDVAAVDAAFQVIRPAVVLHMAGRVVGSRDADEVLPTIRANLLGTVHLLLAALGAGRPRVVIAGTLLQHPDDRDALAVPPSPYGASKWAASAYARMFFALYDLPTVVVRLPMVYGPGQADASKIVPYLIGSFARGESPRLSSGAWEVDWLYVDDAADALIAAGQRAGVDGETIDVGSGERVSIRDVCERIRSIMRSTVEPTYGALPDRQLELDRAIDLSKAARSLGWRARTDLDTGLRQTVDWFTAGRPADTRASPVGGDVGPLPAI